MDVHGERTPVQGVGVATQGTLCGSPQSSAVPTHRPELVTSYRRLAVATAEKSRTLCVERRSNRRYPIDLSMQYDMGRRDGQGLPRIGSGQVVNISSGGILISSDRAMPAGLRIRLRIEWPARLNDAVPLALHIEGRTVRSNGNLTAVRILRSEFRTRALSGALRDAG